MVNEQWDGWANPPDRPWNLLAVLNSVMRTVYTVNGSNDHSLTSLDSMSEAVKISETIKRLGGKTTAYMILRTELPLTRPLRQLGVPGWVVDEIDKLLTPLILTGYSTVTPGLGPHSAGGQLVSGSPPPPPVDPTPPSVEGIQTAAVQTGTSSSPPQMFGARTAQAQAAATVEQTGTGSQPHPQPIEATDTRVDVVEPHHEDIESSTAASQFDDQPQASVTPPTGPADTAEIRGSLRDDPEPEAVERPRPTSSPRPANSVDEGGQPNRPRTNTSDPSGSLKDGPEPGAIHRPKSTPARESADYPSADSEASKPAA